MGKVVGIISLKGGVGKTSSVVSLGASLSKFGKKVLIIDGNFSAPNLGIHLDIIDPEKTIHHVLTDEHNINDTIIEKEWFDVIPASVFYNSEYDPLKLKSKLRGVKNKYDVILIDSSPSLDRDTAAVMSASDEILVVTTPDYSTLSMTLKAISSAKKKNVPISGLILNKAYGKNFELSLSDIEKTSEVPVMAVIPHDINVARSQSNFEPYTHYSPRSSGAREYERLARMIVGEKARDSKIRQLLNRITPERQEINRQIFYATQFN